MNTPNRPPSCDLPQEFYNRKTKLKPCPFCGFKKIFQPTAIPHKVHCYNCECYGPWYDRMGRKWNSIPRRSEMLALIRLVYDVYEWRQHLKGDEFCELRADIRALGEYADKLRKEIGE